MLGALVGAVIGFSRKQSHELNFDARLSALESALSELRRNPKQAPRMPAPGAAVRPEPSAAIRVPEPPPEIPQPVAQQVSPVAPQMPAAEATITSPAPGPAWSEPVSAEPREPSAFDRAWNWFTGGNALVRVGVVVLFFGVAFLLKYAYEHSHVPIEARLIEIGRAHV